MKTKRTPFNNIFFRVYGGFAAEILIFALVLGIFFISIYRSSNMNYYKNRLNTVAETVSEKFRNCILDEDYAEALDYIQNINAIETVEIWTVANVEAEQPMNEALVSIDISQVALQKEFDEMVRVAFTGEKVTDTFFSDVHGATTISTACPISGQNMEVSGAIIAIVKMEQLDEMIDSAMSAIIISIVIALILSAALASTFAGRITNPIRKMQRMTREMMQGNYETKTGIDRADEIGEMAHSFDQLSDKLKENEEERRNMEQMRLDFFANVSHELRTPIAVVRAYTESLVDGVVRDESKVHQYYERILRECKSMERLVGDLLTLSKMQNPNFKVEKEPVNLVHILDEVVRGAAAIAGDKGISINMHRDKDVCVMMGDYDRLRQMFMVIFDNAIKFSNENSTVYVNLSVGNKLRVSIRDEGVGITPEELPNIFNKFYKSKLRQNAKGTGLGLAIAKYVAQKHDGTIEVKSEPGKGTEFIFEFDEAHEEDDMS